MPIQFVGLEMHKLKLEILPQIILIVFNNNNNVIKQGTYREKYYFS